MTEAPTPQAGLAPATLTVERDVGASPEVVWESISTAEGLRRWFPLDARVEPGEGGSIWLSWGPGVEAEAPIVAWEPGRRLAWGDREATVSLELEECDVGTRVRLVHVGSGDGPEASEHRAALLDGWRYFLFNLAHALERHAGAERTLVWRRVATWLPRGAAWRRLRHGGLVQDCGAGRQRARVELDDWLDARPVSARPGHHFAAVVPSLADALLFVELEGEHVGVWLSTYGLDPERVAALDRALGARVERALPRG